MQKVSEAAPVQRVAYRVKEVAAATGMSESAVRNLIKDGELPAQQYRSVWLVPAWAVHELLGQTRHRSDPIGA